MGLGPVMAFRNQPQSSCGHVVLLMPRLLGVFFCLVFLGPHPGDVEVPRLGG